MNFLKLINTCKCWWFWGLLLPLNLLAQGSLPAQETFKYPFPDTFQFAHPYIIPGSIQTSEGVTIGQLWAVDGKVILFTNRQDSITIYYRYLPTFLKNRYAFRERDTNAFISGITQRLDPSLGRGGEALEISRIRRSGSISRGISLGNNRDLSVTSGLRLQLEGYVTDDVEIMAAITDENIPIQPDGSTQQINDFDKVYIQLKSRQQKLVLGDFEIQQTGTSYANIYRNVQGIGIQHQHKDLKVTLNGAVAKGKFYSNSFLGDNGRQGPYRLTGKNGERLIIILAGSEKVYVNGEKMQRGEGNDYTMDYNSGEITFTAQRVITNISRIVVDFEYTDRYYNRSLLFSTYQDKLFKDKLTLGISLGREADNLNAPIEALNNDQKAILRLAGDNPNLAAYTGIDSVGVSRTEIRYARKDTFLFNQNLERYVYAPDDPTAIYQITFSFVGAGKGYYRRSNNNINGTVFEWLPPDSLTGQLLGEYAPLTLLPLPRLLQVGDINAAYQLTENIQLYQETALSTEDINRFSPLNDRDNRGWATRSGIQLNPVPILKNIKINSDLHYRFVSREYQNIDRIYKVEYGREWNYDDLGIRREEKLGEGSIGLLYKSLFGIKALLGYRNYGTFIHSSKQNYEINSQHSWIQGKHLITALKTVDDSLRNYSTWFRQNADWSHTWNKLKPGIEIWTENRIQRNVDSLLPGTFKFTDLKPYLRTVDLENLRMDISYNYRKDQEWYKLLVRDKAIAHTWYGKVFYQPGELFTFQQTTTWRDFRVQDTAFSELGLSNSKTLLNNFQQSYVSRKRWINTNLIYEVSSQRVARREIRYVETTPGFGQYEWKDFNENGIQEINEFVLSFNQSAANFIRVLVPGTTLFPTIGVNLNGSIRLEFKRIISKTKNRFKETLRNISLVTNFRTEQKKDEDRGWKTYGISFRNFFGDTALQNALYTFRQDLYFFRNQPGGELSFSFLDNKSRLFLLVGAETRESRSWQGRQRVNINSDISIENLLQLGNKGYVAQELDPRNYQIQFQGFQPKINCQFSRQFRMSGGYEFLDKQNTSLNESLNSRARFHKIQLETKINVKDRNNLNTQISVIRILQEGTPNAAANYELLESFQPGNNLQVQVFGTWFLTPSLEFSMNYDLRASSIGRPIHAGRMQLRALF